MASRTSNDIIPLSRFRAALSRPRGADRMDALISAPNAKEQVQALSTPEFYFLVKDVGFSDSQELIELATPGQLRGCVDLDSWDRDRVQLDAVLPWLAAACEVGYERLGSMWRELDIEMTALTLARLTRIYDVHLGDHMPEEEERPAFTTPDTFFVVVVTAEQEHEVSLVHRIIDFLYRDDPETARRTLMAARSETHAYLEEMSYRWRTGRMADLGYVDMYEALEVFRPLDPDQIDAEENTVVARAADADGDEDRAPGHLPAPVLSEVSGIAFLAQTLSTITDAALTERLEADILFLVNRVLAAAQVSPGNEEAVQLGAAHATATLSLGLEHIAEGDVERARAVLSRVALIRLHRVGYTLTLRLSRFARSLAPWGRTLEPLSDEVLSALLGIRPFFPAVLTGGADVRPFGSRSDLALAANHLRKVGLRIAVAEALGATRPTRDSDPLPLDTHVRTGLCRVLAGQALTAEPLTRTLLTNVSALFSDGRLPDEHRTRAATSLANFLQRSNASHGEDLLPAVLDQWLHDLEETLGGLDDAANADPRFVGVLVD